MTAPLVPPGRAVPPGCCPGCLLEHATEPCPLHRAAGDLLVALRALLRAHDDPAHGGPFESDWARGRAAVAKAEGRAP